MIRLLIACFVLSVSVCTTAAAQDARASFNAGVDAFDAGDFENALRNFQAAYDARPHPSVLANLANCYVELNQPLQAVSHFERFLSESEQIDPATRTEVESALATARGAIASVVIEAPDDLEVFVDGESVGVTPMDPASVNPGEHLVEVKRSGETVHEQRITSASGGENTVTVGVIEETTLDSDGPDDGGSLHIPLASWVLGGVAVATLIGGIAFGVSALSQSSDVDDLVAQYDALPRGHPDRQRLAQEAQSADDSRAVAAVLSDVLLISAALSAGAAVLVFFLADDDEDGVQASASVTPDGGAVVIQGAF